jgi:hypothetical protein
LLDPPFCLLTLITFYRFGFAARRLLCTSEKAMTSDLEIEREVGAARVATDGHGESFLDCDSMKAARSASVNSLRGRLRPWPIIT